jgi:hypothetical protein
MKPLQTTLLFAFLALIVGAFIVTNDPESMRMLEIYGFITGIVVLAYVNGKKIGLK